MTNIRNELEELVAEKYYGDLDSASWSFYPCDEEEPTKDLIDALSQHLHKAMREGRISDYMVKNKRFFTLGSFVTGCVIATWSRPDNLVDMMIFDYVMK